MEYITAEQFLEQPKEVQKVFLEWWKPSNGDIYWWKQDGTIDFTHNKGFIDNKDCANLKENKDIIPLLTEGQLRKFIEDKTDKTMDFKINVWKYKPLVVEISLKDEKLDIGFKTYEGLLQVLWKVALEIAKESVENE
jgi:hypothetical protein